MKDFGAEIRAYRDVENFLDRTLLILNLDKTSLQDILETMLQKIKDDKVDGEKFCVDTAVDATYCHQTGKVKSLHETLIT